MNKAFKVLWNDVRRSYVVSSEACATRGKPDKSAKTLVGAAVTGALALSMSTAGAEQITVNKDYVQEQGTTKFISAHGNGLNIQTQGDARNFLKALLSKDWTAIRNALGTPNGTVTLVGAAGGSNLTDSATDTLLGQLGQSPTFGKLAQQFGSVTGDLSGNTSVVLGSNTTNPFVVATVVGDRVVNLQLGAEAQASGVLSLTRTGNSKIDTVSGNSLLMVGASSAINVGSVATLKMSENQEITLKASETNVTLDGNSEVNLGGTTTSLGTFAGGSAVALGGKATSTVTGSTTLTINTQTKGEGFEGITVGAVGGGLAVGILGGEASTTVGGKTTVDVQDGVLLGAVGGGIAFGGDLDKEISGLLPDQLKTMISLTESAKGTGGIATAISQDIEIKLGKGASSALIIGGGLAGAYQWERDTVASKASATANNVTIVVGEEGAGSAFKNNDEKGAYFKAVRAGLKSLSGLLKGDTSALGNAEKEAQDLINALNGTPGVNVGIIGGGLAASWSREQGSENVNGQTIYAQSAPSATVMVENVGIEVLSGYNVGVIGGGVAAASGNASNANGEQLSATLAQSDVGTVTMNFAGGETIGVMGGGIALAVGKEEMNYGLGAVSTVGTVNINVIGGSVDGIVGGGYAIDDTNPVNAQNQPVDSKTASSTVQNVNITATSGNIGRLAFDSFFGQNTALPNGDKPSARDYLDSMTYAMIQGRTAIVGGGIAAGNRDDEEVTGGAHVDNVSIAIGGKTFVGLENNLGNIYGGGIATEGGLSTVGNVEILVADDAVIYGDIYGGGLALQGKYKNAATYNYAKAAVETVDIVIAGGTVHGDIYAGGRVITSSNANTKTAESIVENASVTLYQSAKLEGKNIDANGVENAALTLVGDAFDLDSKTVKAFNKVTAQAVKNFNFAFGDKKKTEWSGLYDVESITATQASTIDLLSGAVAIKEGINNVTFNVTGGVLAVGSATAQEAFDNAAGAPAMYLSGAVNLNGVNATIGTAEEGASGSLVLGSNALVAADAGAKTVVNGAGATINGFDVSKLYFTNVATDDASVTFNGLTLDDLDAATLDNIRYVAVFDSSATNKVIFEKNDSGIMLASLGLDGFDTAALDQIEKQTDDASELIKDYLDGQNKSLRNGDHRHAQLNAAFNLAAAGGVQTAGIEGAMIGLDQVAKRASLTNTFNDGVMGFAEVTGTQVQMGGSRNMLETKTQLGGLAFGGEYTQGDWTIGALANVGTGEVKGHGDNGGVKNDVDYYGLQAYAARRIGDFNIVGQAGWMTTSNDIVHGSGDSVDVDADVWTVGARGEMNVKFSDELSFVPYVGVNYLRVSTDGYTTKKGFKVEDTDQNLVNMPIGVAVSGTKSFDNGWVVKSVFDVGYVHMFGDTNVEADMLVGQARMGTDLDVWSENVGRARLGFEAQKDAMALGFGLGMAAGSDDYREVYGQVSVKYVF